MTLAYTGKRSKGFMLIELLVAACPSLKLRPESKNRKGFTLIELLVVIAIIGLLSTLAIVALGTARQKSRDARRLADLRQIQTSIEMYASENNGMYPVTSGVVLLGDSAHACIGSNGFNPAGSCTNQYISFPTDPSGGYYTYSGLSTNYTVAAILEGAASDLSGGVSVSPYGGITACPSSVVYSGQVYNTVKIGSQCWFKQNLNVGTMLAYGTSTPTLGNGQAEKWCYNSDPAICATEGGLYTWAEANQLSGSPNCDTNSCSVPANNQGICPYGWHIPTDQEFKNLEMYLGMTQAQADLGDASWRGTDQGTQLSPSTTPAAPNSNSSGFTALIAGYRNPDGSFRDRSSFAYFWFASEASVSGGWRRALGSGTSTVQRYADTKSNGCSVRCLKN